LLPLRPFRGNEKIDDEAVIVRIVPEHFEEDHHALPYALARRAISSMRGDEAGSEILGDFDRHRPQ
jgi:hypothetical protein